MPGKPLVYVSRKALCQNVDLFCPWFDFSVVLSNVYIGSSFLPSVCRLIRRFIHHSVSSLVLPVVRKLFIRSTGSSASWLILPSDQRLVHIIVCLLSVDWFSHLSVHRLFRRLIHRSVGTSISPPLIRFIPPWLNSFFGSSYLPLFKALPASRPPTSESQHCCRRSA